MQRKFADGQSEFQNDENYNQNNNNKNDALITNRFVAFPNKFMKVFMNNKTDDDDDNIAVAVKTFSAYDLCYVFK